MHRPPAVETGVDAIADRLAAMVRTAVCIGPASFGAPAAEGAPGGWPALERVTERIADLADAFGRLGYACTTLDGEHTAAELGAAVRAAMADAQPSDVLVVHVFSHGEVTATGALHVIGADGVRHELTDVGRWLQNVVDAERAPMTLFLLDICYAGSAARLDWLTRVGDADARAWVIAACAPNELAYGGRFTDAVTGVLRDLAEQRLDIDESYRNAPITTIAQQIRRDVTRRAADADGLAQRVTASLVDISSPPPDLPFFPNPRFDPDPRRQVRTRVDAAVMPFLEDVDEALDAAHFVGRAAGQGSLTGGRLAGCFSGRGQQVKELAPWLNLQDRVGLRVVTGSPGVGKSALIGVLVCAAHPQLRESTAVVWDHLKQRPYRNDTLAAVHARERTPAQVVASIAGQLGLATGGDPAALIEAVTAMPTPPVIVVDALDEAIDGRAVMERLLLPLTEVERPDGESVRVLVGMRPWDEFRPLREAAVRAGGLHDLDEVDAEQLRDDLEEYVGRLMRADTRWKRREYVGARAALAREVAESLTAKTADREWGAFLVAGLFTYHVLNTYAEPVRDVEAALALGATVPRTLPDLLELDLGTRTEQPWISPVLTALAHAKGEGMPAETLGSVAAALGDGGRPAKQDVLDALAAVAFYLRHSAEVDGTTRYRLFHQGLADHLRSAADTGRVLDGLLASVDSASGRRWELAEPYLLRHIAAHAREAGRIDELVTDAGFLVSADPRAVLPEFGTGDATSTTIAAYRLAAGGSFVTDDRRQRRQTLTLAAIRCGGLDLAHAVATLPDAEPLVWRPLWVDLRNITVAAILTEQDDSIAMLGTVSGALLLRDFAGGDVLLDRRKVHAGPVTAICGGLVGGRAMVLSAGTDQMVVAHRLDGSRPYPPIAVGEPVDILALGDLAGQPVAVVVSPAGTAGIWDLPAGRRVGSLDSPVDLAECLTVGEERFRLARDTADPDQAVVFVADGLDATLRHDAPVTAAAGGGLAGSPIIFSGDEAGEVRAWSLALRREMGRLRLGTGVLGLCAAAGSEVLVQTAREVLAFRFQPDTNIAFLHPVRLGVLGAAAPDAEGEPLRWRYRGRPAVERPAPAPAPGGKPAFHSAATTDLGGQRTVNCDAVHAGTNLLAVADGWDFGPGGDLAGRIAVDVMSTLDNADRTGSLVASLRNAAITIVARLRDTAAADPTLAGMGTALTAVLLAGDEGGEQAGNEIAIVHVGDSRLYRLRDNELTQITVDGASWQLGSDQGTAASGPPAKLLSPDGRDIQLAYRHGQVLPGDRLLLCSHGLSEVVPEMSLSFALDRYRDPQEAADRLVKLALSGNAKENVSAVVADVT